MLTVLYVEALLTDSKMADQVWALWDAGFIGDELAAIAWWAIPRTFNLRSALDCQQ